MKDHEIRDLAQRFGIIGLFLSKRHLDGLFALAREIEKRAKVESLPHEHDYCVRHKGEAWCVCGKSA